MASYPAHGMLEQETRAGAVAPAVNTKELVVSDSSPNPDPTSGKIILTNEDGTLGVINDAGWNASIWCYGPNSSYNTADGTSIFMGGGPVGFSIQAMAWGAAIELPLYITADWSFGVYGAYHIAPANNNTNDIGSTTQRVRKICVGTNVDIAAGTAARAQLSLAAGTAPTTPVNGDIWFDGTALKIRIGGATKTFTVA